MSEYQYQGLDSSGLDEAFEAQERRKSDLLLEARLLGAQGQSDAAASRYAAAAEIEERLGEICLQHSLRPKAWVHLFSAMSCWATAGNFYEAVVQGEALLGHRDLSDPLRARVQDYMNTIKRKRSAWYDEMNQVGAENEIAVN